MISYSDYPKLVVEDIVRLQRRIDDSRLPSKTLDRNLLVGSWNIQGLGRVYEEWSENPKSPKRNMRAMACIAEVVKRFDATLYPFL